MFNRPAALVLTFIVIFFGPIDCVRAEESFFSATDPIAWAGGWKVWVDIRRTCANCVVENISSRGVYRKAPASKDAVLLSSAESPSSEAAGMGLLFDDGMVLLYRSDGTQIYLPDSHKPHEVPLVLRDMQENYVARLGDFIILTDKDHLRSLQISSAKFIELASISDEILLQYKQTLLARLRDRENGIRGWGKGALVPAAESWLVQTIVRIGTDSDVRSIVSWKLKRMLRTCSYEVGGGTEQAYESALARLNGVQKQDKGEAEDMGLMQ